MRPKSALLFGGSVQAVCLPKLDRQLELVDLLQNGDELEHLAEDG